MHPQSTPVRYSTAPVERLCDHCGSRYVRPLWRLGRFCTPKCSKAARSPSLETLTARFWSKVDRSGPCWIWTGSVALEGYGQIWRLDRHVRATAVAWEFATGTPPAKGLCVLHICDTPACVRNDEPGVYEINGRLLPRQGHLVVGTHRDNSLDRDRKGRGGGAPGTANGNVKLTPEIVLEIRRLRCEGLVFQELATRFGISLTNVQAICRRKIWRHI